MEQLRRKNKPFNINDIENDERADYLNERRAAVEVFPECL